MGRCRSLSLSQSPFFRDRTTDAKAERFTVSFHTAEAKGSSERGGREKGGHLAPAGTVAPVEIYLPLFTRSQFDRALRAESQMDGCPAGSPGESHPSVAIDRVPARLIGNTRSVLSLRFWIGRERAA